MRNTEINKDYFKKKQSENITYENKMKKIRKEIALKCLTNKDIITKNNIKFIITERQRKISDLQRKKISYIKTKMIDGIDKESKNGWLNEDITKNSQNFKLEKYCLNKGLPKTNDTNFGNLGDESYIKDIKKFSHYMQERALNEFKEMNSNAKRYFSKALCAIGKYKESI